MQDVDVQDLIDRLENRLRRTLDKDDQVVYNLARALKVLEEIKAMRDNRKRPRGRKI